MKELANRGSIEEGAVIQYVVDGIYNDVNSKMALNNAKDLQDLKEKLRVYEKVKEKRCGARPKQSQGYIPNKTPEGSTSIEDQTSSQRIHVVESTPYSKKLIIEGKELTALIDTGSAINIVKQNICKEIGKDKFDAPTMMMNGFGNGKVKILESINCTLMMDNEEFTARMHVVPEDIMHVDITIGRELLSTVYLTINGSSISISKQEPRSGFDIMAINTVLETGLDIGATSTNQQRRAIETLK
ncbi:hypothetical protein Trydic_g12633 [Trypoxylus dichotomus]